MFRRSRPIVRTSCCDRLQGIYTTTRVVVAAACLGPVGLSAFGFIWDLIIRGDAQSSVKQL